MPQYIINGGKKLVGSVTVGGAKNAVLPILCACILCDTGTVTLTNCPDISDVTYTVKILKKLGCKVCVDGGQITVDATNSHFVCLDCDEIKMLRSTALFLGAQIGRFNNAEQCLPGGCELGPRPIDLHLLAFAEMGITVTLGDGVISCDGCARSANINLKFPSVGATENIMLAACKSDCSVKISGAAREPEIVDLQNFINAMGGKIRGAGTDTIIIEGVEKLVGVNYNIISDRIEAATYMAAALTTNGNVTVNGINFEHILSFTDFCVNVGGGVVFNKNSVTVSRASPWLLAVDYIETAPYPAFATDAQSLALSVLTLGIGTSCICEKIFSDRLGVAAELNKMGADITVIGNRAYVNGVKKLHGANVSACDLRSGAALVIAALGAEGTTVISGAHHILRGYQNLLQNLTALGADIQLIKDT